MRRIFAAGVALAAAVVIVLTPRGPEGEAPLADVDLSGEEGVRSYGALWTEGPPVIDGVLDDPAWAAAGWTEPFGDISGPEEPVPRYRTEAKILWDEGFLYVGARLEEPHLWATLRERDAIIYRDHDFEVFLDPDGDGLNYFELEINALGTEFDLFLDKPYQDGGRAEIDWGMPGLRSAVHLEGTLNDPSDEDRGWSVEIAIPWSDLVPPGEEAAAPPHPGDEWRVNFSRVQWPLEVVGEGYRKAEEPTSENPHPEDNWVWSPQGEIDMHVPAHWGVLRFLPAASGE